MKKLSIIFTVLLAFTALAFAGCGKSQTKINISRENLDLVAEGKTLTLDLTGIPSTGYEWTCETDNKDLLIEKSHETKDPEGDSSKPMVGTSVTEHYTFEVSGSGEARLTAKYARSWEESPDDIEHVFIVTIEDGEITMVNEEGEPTIDELMIEAMTVPESGVTESEAL